MAKRGRDPGTDPPPPKAAKVAVACTAYRATCLRQSLGSAVPPEWKAAINVDVNRIGSIVWLGSRAFLHYLTTQVATGKTTLPATDNALNRLVKTCFTVACSGTLNTASRRDPAYVAWKAEWDAHVAAHLPQAAAVSVSGLGNALQFEVAEYVTAVKKHLREGVAALYARTLRSNAAGGLFWFTFSK